MTYHVFDRSKLLAPEITYGPRTGQVKEEARHVTPLFHSRISMLVIERQLNATNMAHDDPNLICLAKKLFATMSLVRHYT
jgi:hypothetical protein